MTRIIRLLTRFGPFRDRVRDPYTLVHNAQEHLSQSFFHTASFRERGIALPHQQEAIAILDQCRMQLVKRMDWGGV